MKNGRMLACDVEKLTAKLEEIGVTATQVCEDAGYGAGYLAGAKIRGTISQVMANYLKMQYGIEQYDYAPVQETECEVLKRYLEGMGKAMMLQLNELKQITKTLEDIKADLHKHGADTHNWKVQWMNDGGEA